MLEKFEHPIYRLFDTSSEILFGIEEYSGESVLKDGSKAYEIYYRPDDKEMQEVINRAWDIAHPRTKTLFWRETSIFRPNPQHKADNGKMAQEASTEAPEGVQQSSNET